MQWAFFPSLPEYRSGLPKKNRWRIETKGAANVIVSYRLLCNGRSVTTNWVGEDLLVLNGAAAFVTLVERARRRTKSDLNCLRNGNAR